MLKNENVSVTVRSAEDLKKRYVEIKNNVLNAKSSTDALKKMLITLDERVVVDVLAELEILYCIFTLKSKMLFSK